MAEHKVIKLSLKDDLVRVRVQDDDTETDFTVYAADFWNLGIREGDIIGKPDYETLSSLHGYCYAYRRCLRKLAYRDCSVREIADLLHQQDHLEDAQREQILQQLQDTHLLDDERLVRNTFEYDEARLTGHKKTAYELQKRGVERELIDGYLNEAEESGEIERCRQKAEQLVRSIRNRSHRETMSVLRQRLVSSGYESHAVTAALAEAQIGKDENLELESLKKEVEKAVGRYSRKYGRRQLRSRIYEHALRKGYSRDDIAQALSELEVSDDENQ